MLVGTHLQLLLEENANLSWELLKMKLKQLLIVLLVIIVLVSTTLYSIATEVPGPMNITRQQAIEISKKEALKLGYDVDSMNLEIDENNTTWNKYIKLDPDPDMLSKLKNRKYWAVSYSPRDDETFGGDVWILIDKNDGHIIEIIRGK